MKKINRKDIAIIFVILLYLALVVVILVIPFPVKFEIFFNDSVIKTSSPAFKFCLSAVAVKVAVKFPSAANDAIETLNNSINTILIKTNFFFIFIFHFSFR